MADGLFTAFRPLTCGRPFTWGWLRLECERPRGHRGRHRYWIREKRR